MEKYEESSLKPIFPKTEFECVFGCCRCCCSGLWFRDLAVVLLFLVEWNCVFTVLLSAAFLKSSK